MLDRVRRAPEVQVLAPGPVTTTAPRSGTRAGTGAGTGAAGAPAHVWYVSYGSNLLRERFEAYLLGGRVTGLDRSYPGGPGTAPASADRAVVLPGRLLTALDAPAWGDGGVAFWDPVGAGPGVLGRAWRVRLQQYLEVVHLENGGTEREPAPWPRGVLADGTALLDDGWYGRLVVAGQVDGEPALTFTHPAPGTLAPRPASARYAAVVRRGLLETFGAPGRGGLVDDEAGAYLGRAYSEG